MLVKNFGVSKQGRVVFCNFRKMPEPQTYEQEMAAEPWYYVGPKDIFPEEFLNFLGIPRGLKKVFVEHHGDLLEPDYWISLQRDLEKGIIPTIVPYSTTQSSATAQRLI